MRRPLPPRLRPPPTRSSRRPPTMPPPSPRCKARSDDLKDATRLARLPRSPTRPRQSRRRSTVPTSFTTRASRFRPPAASWRLKLCGVRAPPAATSTRRSPAFRWPTPQASQLSEFFGSGRQSRIALKAVGKLPSMTLTGYYEADWLSSGTTSNNNQSNSYTMRQRQICGPTPSGERLGLLRRHRAGRSSTETTSGLTRGTEILPSTIDAQYAAGFVWARQYSFRVSKDFGKKIFLGASVENAEMLNPSGQNLPTNYLLRFNRNRRRPLQLHRQLLLQLHAGLCRQDGLRAGLGPLGNLRHRAQLPRSHLSHHRARPYNSTKRSAPASAAASAARSANKKVTIGLKGLWGQGVGRYGSSTIADVTLRPDATISPTPRLLRAQHDRS